MKNESRRIAVPYPAHWVLVAALCTSASSWSLPPAKPDGPGLAAYDFTETSGLHSTIVAKEGLPEFTLKGGVKVELDEKATGYADDLEAVAHFQDHEAPLAVLLVGMPGRASDHASRFWMYRLHQAGLHVLAFDSVFHPDFYQSSRHGVSGNPRVEARVLARVIRMAVEASGKSHRIRGTHLVGISYGGNLALTINQMAMDGELDMEVERVLVLSPTLEMRSTARLLDRWTEQDLEPRSIFDLIPLSKAKPLKPGEKTSLSDSLMRAGIAWVLHRDLTRTVKKNARLYAPNLLSSFKKHPDPELRQLASPAGWEFTRYWEMMAYPYWRTRGGPQDVDAFWDLSGIDHLMAAKPDNVRVVVAEDDPLNDPDDLVHLMHVSDPDALVVLPHGGHLGYMRTQWLLSYIQSWLGT